MFQVGDVVQDFLWVVESPDVRGDGKGGRGESLESVELVVLRHSGGVEVQRIRHKPEHTL